MNVYDTLKRTKSGKIFQLQDLLGNPVEIAENDAVFPESKLEQVELNGYIRSIYRGVMLKRIL